MELFNQDVIILSFWKLTREEVLKGIGDFKYFLDMGGFSHTIDGFDEYFKENEDLIYNPPLPIE